jgi:hypothetical protein
MLLLSEFRVDIQTTTSACPDGVCNNCHCVAVSKDMVKWHGYEQYEDTWSARQY